MNCVGKLGSIGLPGCWHATRHRWHSTHHVSEHSNWRSVGTSVIGLQLITKSVPCLRPCSTRNCWWAADLARGREWTQKFWRKFTWILNCLIMCQSQT